MRSGIKFGADPNVQLEGEGASPRVQAMNEAVIRSVRSSRERYLGGDGVVVEGDPSDPELRNIRRAALKAHREHNQIGQLVKQYRLDQKMSARELADKSGLTMLVIYHLENGRKNAPSIWDVISLAAALGVSATDLVPDLRSVLPDGFEIDRLRSVLMSIYVMAGKSAGIGGDAA